MFTTFLISLLVSANEPNADAPLTCERNAAQLLASYTINVSDDTHTVNTTELELWRNQASVAHQYQQTGITEAWTRVKNQWLKPVRYFDNHQRAIEYQPGERIHGKVDSDWSYRYQLVSDALLSTMTLEETSGSGCEATYTYRLEHQGHSYSLTWLPALKLVKAFEARQGQLTRTWTLNKISYNRTEITDFFEQRKRYKSTDYSDIGDDHTDPFLTNMVNQGFIEAGASGFYHANGQAIEGNHSHR